MSGESCDLLLARQFSVEKKTVKWLSELASSNEERLRVRIYLFRDTFHLKLASNVWVRNSIPGRCRSLYSKC